MKQFSPAERSTFAYWFAHWRAFQYVAWRLHLWRPRYLLHDCEKPWLRLFWDYRRVQQWHRRHNSHHLDNGTGRHDWTAMLIDWECSRLTKSDTQLTAYETYVYEWLKHEEMRTLLEAQMLPLLQQHHDQLVQLPGGREFDHDDAMRKAQERYDRWLRKWGTAAQSR